MEKLQWHGYPTVKNFEVIFIRFDRVHERVRQTDGRTDTDIRRVFKFVYLLTYTT